MTLPQTDLTPLGGLPTSHSCLHQHQRLGVLGGAMSRSLAWPCHSYLWPRCLPRLPRPNRWTTWIRTRQHARRLSLDKVFRPATYAGTALALAAGGSVALASASPSLGTSILKVTAGLSCHICKDVDRLRESKNQCLNRGIRLILSQEKWARTLYVSSYDYMA